MYGLWLSSQKINLLSQFYSDTLFSNATPTPGVHFLLGRSQMPAILLKTAVPGPKSQALAARRAKSVARGVPAITPMYVASAKDATITDVDGNRFLDFAGGIGVNNAGHAQPAVTAAIQKQAAEFLHTCFMVSPYESYVALAEKLNALVPGDFEKRSFFVNSGAEAVENAVKIARSFTGKRSIICFDDAYHGRTYMAMALTAKEKPYKYGFGPFSEEVHRLPFANTYRMENAVEASLTAVENCLQSHDDIAAILFEPIQGEGGFIVAPPEFVTGLRKLADKYKVLLIADEIQTGFGRTGRVYAMEHYGVAADIVLSAKSMASGMPIAALTGRADVMDQPGPGAVGGTYGGNPVACVAGLATVELFADGKLLRRSNEIGERFSARVEKWKQRFDVIGDLRGLGGMQAIELVLDRKTKEPATDLTKEIQRRAYEHGLILVTAGTLGNVIRILVPLVVTDAELDEGLDVLEACIAAATEKK
jgi:4-aminobutyrate aminotransferase/(S)-3-amino-2-methylpropionate transaminase